MDDLTRNLRVDSVSRLQPTAPLRIGVSQTVAEAVAVMRQERVGCLLVCEQERLVGIFTERDLLTRVLATGRPLTGKIREVMTPNPTVVGPKEPAASALKRMEEGSYRHLPVVDEAGRPLGVLSVKRIVHYLVEHFPTAVYNLPPDPASVPHEPDGA